MRTLHIRLRDRDTEAKASLRRQPRIKQVLGLVAVLGALSAVSVKAVEPAAVPAKTNDWSFDVVPYLWAASLDVETGLPSTEGGVARYDTRISAGAMIAAQARYRSAGVFVDFDWLQLDTQAISPGPAFSSVDLKSDFLHATAALSYRLPLRSSLQVDVLAGARVWYVNEEIKSEAGLLPGFKIGNDHCWADPLVGVALHYPLSKRWFLVGRGSVGGFGVAADLAWEALLGAGYQITDWCSASAGYRYLYEDYDQNGYALNLDAHGLILGFGFHF